MLQMALDRLCVLVDIIFLNLNKNWLTGSRQRFTLAKTKAYTGIFPLAEALLSTDRPRWEFLAAIIIIIIKQENDYSDVRQLIAVARALYKIKLKTHMLIVQ